MGKEERIDYPTCQVPDLNASSLRVGAKLYPLINPSTHMIPDTHGHGKKQFI